MNPHAALLRRLGAKTSANPGLVTVTKWQLERAADEIDRLTRLAAELETDLAGYLEPSDQPSLFDGG